MVSMNLFGQWNIVPNRRTLRKNFQVDRGRGGQITELVIGSLSWVRRSTNHNIIYLTNNFTSTEAPRTRCLDCQGSRLLFVGTTCSSLQYNTEKVTNIEGRR